MIIYSFYQMKKDQKEAWVHLQYFKRMHKKVETNHADLIADSNQRVVDLEEGKGLIVAHGTNEDASQVTKDSLQKDLQNYIDESSRIQSQWEILVQQ